MELSCYNLSWYTLGSSLGFLWGFIVSTSTLTTCTAVSISAFMNTYYAGILIFLGGALILKFHKKNRQIQTAEPPLKNQTRKSIGENLFHVPFDLRQSILLDKDENAQIEWWLQFLELFLAWCVFLSGVMLAFLEEDWFKNINYEYKIIPYSLFGLSISFVMTVSVLDGVEAWKQSFCLKKCLRLGKQKPVIVSNLQYFLVLAGSMALGLFMGYLYGSVDLEDIKNRIFMLQMMSILEDYVFGPLGCYFGVLIGFMFTFLRQAELEQRQKSGYDQSEEEQAEELTNKHNRKEKEDPEELLLLNESDEESHMSDFSQF